MLAACTNASTAPSPDGHTQVVLRVAPWLFTHHGHARAIVIFSHTKRHVIGFVPGSRSAAAIFSEDVQNAGAGSAIALERDAAGYPAGLDALPSGTYYVMALLDWDGTYAYSGVSSGMYVSAVSRVQIRPGTRVTIELTRPAFGRHSYPYGAQIQSLEIPSPQLSAFWHTATSLHAVVLLPPGYAQDAQRYPVVYVIHSFRNSAQAQAFESSPDNFNAPALLAQMRAGTLPKMIFVFPDARSRFGHTEFADSANNGPWGAAFVRDLVPYVERTYRVRQRAQFLTGHSSGAWSALWLQVRYPKLFAGAWAVSPDPVDFRSFLGTDIYARGANAYRGPQGEKPFERAGTRTVLTVREAARLESVEGAEGGQLASFEAVFSPRAADGMPQPLFDRRTGTIDPRVAQAWRSYDISAILARHDRALLSELRGKLHIIVGSRDNYFLNEPAQRLAANVPAQIVTTTIVAGRNHFDMYRDGLTNRIVEQMQKSRNDAAPRIAAGR